MRSKLPVIGAAAALLAGVGIIAAIWSNGTKQSAACAPFKHATVPDAAKKVLAGYAGRIQDDVERSPSGAHDESWNDSVTGSRRQVNYDEQGRIESVFGTTESGRVTRTVWVLYPAHNWTSEQHQLPFSTSRIANQAAQIAQGNRDKVANGKAKILGRNLIGGRVTLHLRERIHFPAPKPPSGMPLPKGFKFPAPPDIRVDTWVDPVTYLPVRTATITPNGGASSLTVESWLPRAPANVAKTKVVIPASFTHNVPHNGTAFSTGTLLSRVDSCSQS